MSVIEFLTQLAEKDIRLWVEDGKLRFSAAEGAFTDEIKQEVVNRKTELIEFLSQAKKAHQEPIPRIPRDQPLALSFAQQRLWFLNQLEPDNSSYNMPTAIRIQGKLDLEVLKKTFSEIICRHEILRTTYREDDETPLQIIPPATDWPLEIEPISAPANSSEADFLKTLCQAEASKLFDLEQGPIMRTRLLQIAADDYVLLIIVHHIASDGWSMGILVGEIVALYKAFCENSLANSPLPKPGVQYADYSAWQLKQLSGENLERQLGYWRQQLQAVPILQLPSDYQRSAILGNQGGCINFTLNQALTQALKSLSKQQDATLFMTLLAAFSTLLHRFSQQDDFAIGIPVANRSHSSLDTLVGCFVNTLALRSDLSDNPSFLEVLSRTKTTCKEGFNHQDIPFERVVDELGLSRDMSHSPVFQVMFTLQNAPTDQHVHLPGLELELIEFETGTAQFELKLAVLESENNLQAAIEYNSSLFSQASIERLIRYFQTLLAHITANPAQAICQIPLISDEEKNRLLSTKDEAWNATEVLYPQQADALHHLFEQQASRTPDATAISYQQQQLSYQQLNEKANQLAHYLQAQGVGPDTLVGVAMERSLEMSVALLGILKAGGAYVPFDPSFPNDRLAFMLTDTQVQIVLTQSYLSKELPFDNINKIFLDSLSSENSDSTLWSTQPSSNLPGNLQEDNLFNVIFTSGSTGKPKGVMVPHRGIINRLLWMQESYPLNAKDIVLQKTPYSFDVSVWELFWPLIVGAQIEFAKPDGHKDPTYLKEIIQNKGITTLHFVPSMLGVFLQTEDIEDCGTIKRIFCSGEALQLEHERRFFECFAHTELHNLYGPTEASVDVSYFACSANSQYRSVPIGKPVSNTQLHILDENLQPVPIGIAGELYIGGTQLARGYLNRIELTEKTFIANPYHSSGHPSPRLYKTGDLARYLPDGNIDYIGRVDFQVKVRGLRIELGEIETVLHQQADICETVIITKELSQDNVQIIAYFVANNQDKPPEAELLREHLRQHLPEYMLPNIFICLEEIPLSANGKVNRKALPTPELTDQVSTEYIAPRNDIEQQLVVIWSDILNVEKIGIHDNFFELGGHSLLATRVASRIKKYFEVELKLRELFDATTVATLAEKIANADGSSRTSLPNIAAQPRNDDHTQFPLSFAQTRLWFIENLTKGGATYNIPSALRINGPLDTVHLNTSLNKLITRHEALRTSFHHNEDSGQQQIHNNVSIVLEQISCTENEVKAASIQFASSPFDLSSAPLIRAKVLCIGPQDHILLLCLHHIIADGWSLDIIINDLIAFYLHQQQGLPELPIQYADYALWQQTHLNDDYFSAHMDYWRKQLEALPKLELPTDFSRPAQVSPEGKGLSFNLDSDLANRVRKFSLQQQVTPYVVLLTVYRMLLCRYSSQSDFAIGTPVANRPQTELENIIGFFVNTLVLRTTIETEDTFCSLLKKAQQTLLDAQQHQDIPFEKLATELVAERNFGQTPLFQTSFTYQKNSNDSQQTLPNELSIAPLNNQDQDYDIPVKFDLQCSFSDQGEDKEISGAIEGRTTLFSTDTLKQLAKHFIALLEAALSEPDKQLCTLPMLSANEHKQLLHTWNSEKSQTYTTNCIHQQFEQIVERYPDHTAIAFNNEQISYAELNKRANQLARQLAVQGVTVGAPVGLCLERSIDLLVGILGILKAGGAYIPLDPHFPNDRLQFILEDSTAPILITTQALTENLPSYSGQRVLIDTDAQQIAQQEQHNLNISINDSNIIYVLYTSGTTGKPKGCLVTHANVSRLFSATDADFNFNEKDVWTLFHSYAFDFTVWEIWGALLYGGKLVVVPYTVSRSAKEFYQLLGKEQVTVLNQTPSAFSQLIAIDAQQQESDNLALRYIVFGGEALDFQALKLWLKRHEIESPAIINMYGITETTVHVTLHRISEKDIQSGRSLIGKPISDLHAYLLDKHGQLTPAGRIGELHISGAGVTNGYLKRDDLTQEKFITNPYVNELSEAQQSKHQRLYRSGDLARYMPDGTLEYLGRIDHQVKIRGHRIELGEIEIQLAALDSVREAIVTIYEIDNDKRLIAYLLTGKDAADLNHTTLRQQLSQRLPDYMIPSSFIKLEEWPLTPTGKVDKNALPEPEIGQSSVEFVAPRNDIESQLAQIWADILGVEKVGIFDNFFELGGHSILAMQVANKAHEQFQVELELSKLFESPTIATIAELIEERVTEQQLLIDDDDDDDDDEFII